MENQIVSISAAPEETAAAVTTEEITPVSESVKAPETANTSRHIVEKNFPGLNCTVLMEPDDESEGIFIPYDTAVENDRSDTDTENVPGGFDTNGPADEAKLSPDYLSNGFFIGEGDGRYPDPALVSDMAEVLGAGLAICGLKPAAYNSLLKPLKKVNKRTVVFEAKYGALLALRPKIMLMKQKKRAPHILLEIIDANIRELKDNSDFEVCYQHLEAVSAFLQIYGGDN